MKPTLDEAAKIWQDSKVLQSGLSILPSLALPYFYFPVKLQVISVIKIRKSKKFNNLKKKEILATVDTINGPDCKLYKGPSTASLPYVWVVTSHLFFGLNKGKMLTDFNSG